MTSFLNLKIGTRLTLAFGLVIVATVLIGIFGRIALSSVRADTSRLANDRMVKVEQVAEVRNNLAIIASLARDVVLLTETSRMEQEKAKILALRVRNTELLRILDQTVITGLGREKLEAVVKARAPYTAATDRSVALGLQNKE